MVQVPVTILDTLPAEEWVDAGEVVYGAADEDDPKSTRVQCRIPSFFVRKMQELREHPESPYYGRFRSMSDLHRHILIAGILKLMDQDPRQSSESAHQRAREHLLGVVAKRKSKRVMVNDVVEPVISTVAGDCVAGDVESAVGALDDFLTEVVKMGEKGEVYLRALFAHPGFQGVRRNKEVRERSGMMRELEEGYG